MRLILLGLVIVLFAATLHAAELGFIESIQASFASFKNGDTILGIAAAAMALGAAVRFGAGLKWSFWKTRVGGIVIALGIALTALGGGWWDAGGFSLQVLANALVVALAAMGIQSGVSFAKDLAAGNPSGAPTGTHPVK